MMATFLQIPCSFLQRSHCYFFAWQPAGAAIYASGATGTTGYAGTTGSAEVQVVSCECSYSKRDC